MGEFAYTAVVLYYGWCEGERLTPAQTGPEQPKSGGAKVRETLDTIANIAGSAAAVIGLVWMIWNDIRDKPPHGKHRKR